jgi:hypothetical protein
MEANQTSTIAGNGLNGSVPRSQLLQQGTIGSETAVSATEPKLYNLELGLNQFTTDAVTDGEAQRLHGQLHNNEKVTTKDDITYCKAMLATQKDVVRSWAKAKLIDKMINFAQKQQIPHPSDPTTTITTLPQLEQAWASNEELAERVWWVLFGEFDKWHDWDLELEEAFMKEYEWTYIGFSEKTRTKRQKGCVAKVIVWQKAQLVKYVNWATLRSGGHGKTVSVTQPKIFTATQGGKQQFRKKKGIFYNWMVCAHETHHAESTESETHIQSARKSLESTSESADNVRTDREKTASESTVKAKTKFKKHDKVSNLVV